MSISLAMLQIVACVATAATTTYLIVESREKRQFLSGKAEDLYTLVDVLDRELTELLAQSYALICEGRLFRPETDFGWNKAIQDQAKARMLVAFYFPSLLAQAKRADATVASVVAGLHEYQERHPDEAALLSLDQLVVDMRDALETFRHAVVVAYRDGRGHPLGLRRRSGEAAAPRALRMAS